jgi:hypothetical protein
MKACADRRICGTPRIPESVSTRAAATDEEHLMAKGQGAKKEKKKPKKDAKPKAK